MTKISLSRKKSEYLLVISISPTSHNDHTISILSTNSIDKVLIDSSYFAALLRRWDIDNYLTIEEVVPIIPSGSIDKIFYKIIEIWSKINSNHEFFLKFILEVVFTRTGATFFLGIYFINIFVLLLVVYIRFFRTSYFFNSLEERRICTCCLRRANVACFSFYFSFRRRLLSIMSCRIISS